jgi:hypothetical protein
MVPPSSGQKNVDWFVVFFFKFWERRYSDMTGPCDVCALSLIVALILKQWHLVDNDKYNMDPHTLHNSIV